MTQKLQGYGQPQDWDDETYYPIGQSVAHDLGFWRAVVQNRNSEPASDNADWVLIGGTVTISRFFSPPEIQTLNSVPIDIVPSPGPTIFLAPGQCVFVGAQGSGVYSAAPGPLLQYVGNPTGTPSTLDGSGTWDGSSAAVSFLENIVEGMGGVSNMGDPVDIVASGFLGLALQITALADVTGGDAPCLVELTYRWYETDVFTTAYFSIVAVNQGTHQFVVLGDASGVQTRPEVIGSTGNNGTYTKTSATYDGGVLASAITAVNQGAKRFTIAGDHTIKYAVGTTATVAGSTGNDGAYTVVSATLSTGNTLIVVAEAVPDATADGTISDGGHTVIVVVQTIPDTTADGWVQTG